MPPRRPLALLAQTLAPFTPPDAISHLDLVQSSQLCLAAATLVALCDARPPIAAVAPDAADPASASSAPEGLADLRAAAQRALLATVPHLLQHPAGVHTRRGGGSGHDRLMEDVDQRAVPAVLAALALSPGKPLLPAQPDAPSAPSAKDGEQPESQADKQWRRLQHLAAQALPAPEEVLDALLVEGRRPGQQSHVVQYSKAAGRLLGEGAAPRGGGGDGAKEEEEGREEQGVRLAQALGRLLLDDSTVAGNERVRALLSRQQEGGGDAGTTLSLRVAPWGVAVAPASAGGTGLVVLLTDEDLVEDGKQQQEQHGLSGAQVLQSWVLGRSGYKVAHVPRQQWARLKDLPEAEAGLLTVRLSLL